MNNEIFTWEAPQLFVEDVFATLGGGSPGAVENTAFNYYPTSAPG
jgi:hypothetical protein